MAYNIMMVVQDGTNQTSKYQFYRKKDADGDMKIFAAADKAELEVEVESLLETHAKKDFIIVEQLAYNVDTDINQQTETGTEKTNAGEVKDLDSEVDDDF